MVGLRKVHQFSRFVQWSLCVSDFPEKIADGGWIEGYDELLSVRLRFPGTVIFIFFVHVWFWLIPWLNFLQGYMLPAAYPCTFGGEKAEILVFPDNILSETFLYNLDKRLTVLPNSIPSEVSIIEKNCFF